MSNDWPEAQPQWSPTTAAGPQRRSRAPWYVAAGLVVALGVGAALWLTVFTHHDAAPGAVAGSQQDVGRRFIEATRAHDVEAVKKVSCKADLDKIAKDPAGTLIPASVTITSYKITGQHDVGGGPDAKDGATIIDGSVTFVDGKNTVTNPIDLTIIRENGVFKACTSLAILVK